MQAFVHFSALCTRRKVGGTDRFKLRRVPERDATLTLTRLYRVCAKVLRAEGILRGKSGPRDATPPSSRRPRRRRRRRRLFLLCVKTAGVLARIRVKSGVEGSAAERMERSCYFGKLSGRHERIGGGGEGEGEADTRRRVPRSATPINRPTFFPQFRRWPRKRYTKEGARICSPPPHPSPRGFSSVAVFPSLAVRFILPVSFGSLVGLDGIRRGRSNE